MLTQEELKKLLHYNPETGVFTWLVSGNGRKVGQVAGHKHKGTKYLRIKVKCKLYLAHRLAWLYMNGQWPENHIDHINGDQGDNRWENLREATQQQNCLNRGSSKGSSSSYKGVSWHKGTKKWQTFAEFNKKRKYFGLFDCEHEAALVFNQFAMKHHGEYAWFNQVYNHFDVEVGRDD